MYGIFAYASHKNKPHVDKYTLDGSYGFGNGRLNFFGW